MITNPIHAGLAVSISELKKNPSGVMKKAGLRVVAVLNHTKPQSYFLRRTGGRCGLQLRRLRPHTLFLDADLRRLWEVLDRELRHGRRWRCHRVGVPAD